MNLITKFIEPQLDQRYVKSLECRLTETRELEILVILARVENDQKRDDKNCDEHTRHRKEKHHKRNDHDDDHKYRRHHRYEHEHRERDDQNDDDDHRSKRKRKYDDDSSTEYREKKRRKNKPSNTELDGAKDRATKLLDEIHSEHLNSVSLAPKKQNIPFRVWKERQGLKCEKCHKPGHTDDECRLLCNMCEDKQPHPVDKCLYYVCNKCGYAGHNENVCEHLACQICKYNNHVTELCTAACGRCKKRGVFHHYTVACEY